jgi:hypothetical protein
VQGVSITALSEAILLTLFCTCIFRWFINDYTVIIDDCIALSLRSLSDNDDCIAYKLQATLMYVHLCMTSIIPPSSVTSQRLSMSTCFRISKLRLRFTTNSIPQIILDVFLTGTPDPMTFMTACRSDNMRQNRRPSQNESILRHSMGSNDCSKHAVQSKSQ